MLARRRGRRPLVSVIDSRIQILFDVIESEIRQSFGRNATPATPTPQRNRTAAERRRDQRLFRLGNSVLARHATRRSCRANVASRRSRCAATAAIRRGFGDLLLEILLHEIDDRTPNVACLNAFVMLKKPTSTSEAHAHESPIHAHAGLHELEERHRNCSMTHRDLGVKRLPLSLALLLLLAAPTEAGTCKAIVSEGSTNLSRTSACTKPLETNRHPKVLGDADGIDLHYPGRILRPENIAHRRISTALRLQSGDLLVCVFLSRRRCGSNHICSFLLTSELATIVDLSARSARARFLVGRRYRERRHAAHRHRQQAVHLELLVHAHKITVWGRHLHKMRRPRPRHVKVLVSTFHDHP